MVTDFEDGADTLFLDSALWEGNLGTRKLLRTFAEVRDGSLVLEFEGGDRLVLEDIGSTRALLNDLELI